MKQIKISEGTPHVLGASYLGHGTNFAVFSENATAIELCLFSSDGTQETDRIFLPERTGPVWHVYLEGVGPGTLYGYRAHGPFAPEKGHRFNPNKLLLDPYTREMSGAWKTGDAVLGYDPSLRELDMSFSETDSAGLVPKSVVSDPADFAPVLRRQKPKRSDLIYEAHPKGLSQTHPDVPDALKGTYEGIATAPLLAHLKTLGIGALELLPVQGFVDDAFLVKKGLRNYWGYNSIAFFAPEPRYFGQNGLQGFRDMVAALHEEGIDVILDVVYNHTAEADHLGPTLCFRGLDNASYYRLSQENPRFYVNDTGCGNMLNVAHPFVLRMVLDSLRFWVTSMGVDGFRFDLGTSLGREDHGFDPRGGFFDALRQDPVLSQVTLIAEPWDIGPGGYQLGQFPPEFQEWNDRYRDALRRFWRGDDHGAQALAAGLLATAAKFDHSGRRASSSVNFVSAHDGFTLADTTRYSKKHNIANGEKNRDGHNGNYSANWGIEGETDNLDILRKRSSLQRSMLATVMMSQGTPMILAGDEFGNSQEGNNNAYCQDNETGWLNWADADTALADFTAQISAFRAAHPALRQTRFLHGATRASDGLADVEWINFGGGSVNWDDPGLGCFCMIVRGAAQTPEFAQTNDDVLLAFNRTDRAQQLTLPDRADGAAWRLGFTSGLDSGTGVSGNTIVVEEHSLSAFIAQQDSIA